jgi:hypothetical protein
MADLTTQIRRPGIPASAPNYVAVAATDFFTAKSGARYRLHYKNGATVGTGTLKVGDPSTPIPPGSGLAAGFADVTVATNMAATSEAVAIVSGSRHVDGNGRINLAHGGTITTITVAIEEIL